MIDRTSLQPADEQLDSIAEDVAHLLTGIPRPTRAITLRRLLTKIRERIVGDERDARKLLDLRSSRAEEQPMV